MTFASLVRAALGGTKHEIPGISTSAAMPLRALTRAALPRIGIWRGVWEERMWPALAESGSIAMIERLVDRLCSREIESCIQLSISPSHVVECVDVSFV